MTHKAPGHLRIISFMIMLVARNIPADARYFPSPVKNTKYVQVPKMVEKNLVRLLNIQELQLIKRLKNY